MSRVCIAGTEQNLNRAVAEAIEKAGRHAVSGGDRVLLKPNLVQPASPESGEITTPKIVEAVARYCLDCGASKVVIGEGPSYYQSESHLRDCFTQTGISEVARKLGIEWVLFDEHRYRTYKSVPGCIAADFHVTEYAFNCDKLINLPVLKTHWLCKVTLAMKNLKGCLKREDKPLFHRLDINRAVVELCKIVKPTLNIIDCTPGTVSRVMFSGSSRYKKAKGGLVIASTDIVAADAVGSALMGIDPESVETIKLGAAAGLGESDLAKIEITGEEIRSLEFKPRLPQDVLKENFPRLEILGAERACSGCIIPLISVLTEAADNGVKSGEPITICVGEKPPAPNGRYVTVGECACTEGRAGVKGCPPDRDEIQHLIDSLLS